MPRAFSVLLVEDHDPLRQTLLELLDARGWSIHAADRGVAALDVARRVPLDFGIFDMHLPGGSGLELFERINREIRPLPSILMSGEASRHETQRARAAGVFSFLRKPLDFGDLQLELDRLIQHHFPPGAPLS
ncbi:MAG: response regulator [Planctomycetes bacterium]|nr:response regulator [Planctomycetota bacterium]MCB9887995.1 response regulator [Planctomycetota bacterium]